MEALISCNHVLPARPAFASRWAAIFAMSFLASCSTISLFSTHSKFTPTMAYTRVSRAPDKIVLVFQGNVPARPIARVGIVSSNRSDIFSSEENLLKGLRERAAKSGLDGVAEVFCDLGYCTGQGFVFID
ncbi:hypothetical protein OK349_17675 [Sphingomonas sp. BT-65]|uniref:hypothetical protein n=1 Tax=Sphingomonas sp. BT-65 TaxID=2989821 RepID=UPI0022355220|nr:hypothetical protein [Sphingomonas sp. BT-65]MCW4463540.1 hypothetical protein [Sphingomonas sp. BT-65]